MVGSLYSTKTMDHELLSMNHELSATCHKITSKHTVNFKKH